MSIYTIYKVTNLVNGKSYIGFTKHSVLERWQSHKDQAFRMLKRSSVFHCAIRKHGPENFRIDEIYQSFDKLHTLEEMEEYFIKEFETHFYYGYGYNMNFGGTGGDNSSSPNFKKSLKTKEMPKGEKHPHYGGFSENHRKTI